MVAISTEARQQIHRHINWSAGAWAGVIGVVVFMMLEMIMVWLFQGQSPWGPPRMIAAMALGPSVLPQPGTWAPFDLTALMVAMMIHLVLAIVYGLIGAALLGRTFTNRLSLGAATALGAGAGLVIYLINFYPIAATMFPWFAMARGWISAVSHIIFGAVVGAAYMGLSRRVHD